MVVSPVSVSLGDDESESVGTCDNVDETARVVDSVNVLVNEEDGVRL